MWEVFFIFESLREVERTQLVMDVYPMYNDCLLNLRTITKCPIQTKGGVLLGWRKLAENLGHKAGPAVHGFRPPKAVLALVSLS